MTSLIASNADLTSPSEKLYYLRTTKDGAPIDKQVPRTYQTYVGLGGSFNYDGSNEIRIDGSGLTSPLTIQFGPASNVRSWVGRYVAINIYTPNTRTITLNSSPAFMAINGTSLVQLSHVISVDGKVKTIIIYFSSTTIWNIDYGASSSTVVPNVEPRASTLAIEYPYNTESFISLPTFYIPDSTNYSLLYNDLENTKEGTFDPFTGAVAGPGTQNLDFLYRPAPRRTDITTVTGYLENAGLPKISFSCILKPILRNVYDHEYFIGCNSDSTNSMYDPLVDTGGSPLAVDVNGNNVLTDTDTFAIAVDIADSLLFFVTQANNTLIRWRSFTTGERGDLLDVTTQPVSRWPAGTIRDIAFDEKISTLLVLSTNGANPAKVLGIPIKPYDNSNPGNIEMGPVTCSSNFNFGVGSVPYSIAVCPISRTAYIAASLTPTTINITQLFPYPAFLGPVSNSWLFPTITTGAVAMTCTAVGTLLLHFEDTKELYRVVNTGGISALTPSSDVVLLYTLPVFHRSLSPNCYGWRPS